MGDVAFGIDLRALESLMFEEDRERDFMSESQKEESRKSVPITLSVLVFEILTDLMKSVHLFTG